ncbi:MAG: hypothetical protein PHQ23_04525 [Candidatus Wallbacteria bacterium]|nr:hypothetical protein [Candidatus Wallbacteria bacterium]
MDREAKLRKLKLKKRTSLILMLVFVFTSGLLIGSGITLKYLWRGFMHRMTNPEKHPDFMKNRLRDELGLTSEQVNRLDEIMRNHADKIRELHESVRPRIEAEMELSHSELTELLTPEQQEKFNTHFSNMKKVMLFKGGRNDGRKRPGRKPDGTNGAECGNVPPAGGDR